MNKTCKIVGIIVLASAVAAAVAGVIYKVKAVSDAKKLEAEESESWDEDYFDEP